MQREQVLKMLQSHLQTAILLEMSTLPPYLCAYWSIYGTSDHAVHVKKFILSVAQEEMLHLAMACNILNAVGGAPVLNDPNQLACFPCCLPGHSKTANVFTVCLEKCCPSAISTFLKIEMPETSFAGEAHSDGWCTIGEFYDEIEALIKSPLLTDEDFSHGRQAGNRFNPAAGKLYQVQTREDALKALEEIIDQGEGHDGKMFDKDHQLTHYWKFRSVADLLENQIWNYHDEVYDMASDPDESTFSPAAQEISRQFNTAWTQLLDEMHAAFNSDKPDLNKSIERMFTLQSLATQLMQKPLIGKAGNAGPTFRYLPK